MNSDDLKKHIDKNVETYNAAPISDFEGLSANQMRLILTQTPSEESPVQLNRVSDSDYQQIPLLNQVQYILNHIQQQGELKLTTKGYLPPKMVAELYGQGFIKDEMIETGISKLYRESEVMSINLTRILLEISGLVKKRKNELTFTSASSKIIGDKHQVLTTILSTFANRFNWSYYDGYGQNQLAQFGWAFTLVLLAKYGHQPQLDQFYANKYFRAFPELMVRDTSLFRTAQEHSVNAYSIRTFDRFLCYFGIVKIEKEKRFDAPKYIQKTALFDRLITCTFPIIPDNNAS